MYLENVTGMEGEQDFISKFGLEIRDEMTFLVSRRRFSATIPTQLRPNEGDLIYVPLVANFFEISFVEHENDQAMFYTLGRGRGGNVYLYALKMKELELLNEIYVFDTRVKKYKQDEFSIAILEGNNGTNINNVIHSINAHGNNAIIIQHAFVCNKH
jgi:hypothetical protein